MAGFGRSDRRVFDVRWPLDIFFLIKEFGQVVSNRLAILLDKYPFFKKYISQLLGWKAAWLLEGISGEPFKIFLISNPGFFSRLVPLFIQLGLFDYIGSEVIFR